MSCLLPEVGVSLAVARLDEDGEAIEELDQLSTRAVPARRQSFVAGRRAARRAISARLGRLPAGLCVAPDPLGRPLIHVEGRPSTLRLSISHAGGYALAAASGAPLGVDLIELEPLPRAMDDDTFTPEELQSFARALPSPDAILSRCLAFAAKEAALKWLGVGMNLPLRAVRVIAEGAFTGAPPWATRARVLHPDGDARLSLHAWPLIGALWAVLLVEHGQRGHAHDAP